MDQRTPKYMKGAIAEARVPCMFTGVAVEHQDHRCTSNERPQTLAYDHNPRKAGAEDYYYQHDIAP